MGRFGLALALFYSIVATCLLNTDIDIPVFCKEAESDHEVILPEDTQIVY